MDIKYCSFHELEKESADKKIVLFGAGAIGAVIAPEILNDLGLLSRVEFIIDNDPDKFGKILEFHGRTIEIKSPPFLEKCGKDTIIILNVSRFSDVIDQLEKMFCTQYMTCYIMPALLINNYCSDKSGGEPVLTESPMIPKKLHYMWLGKKQIPDNLKRCIESWRRYCPDYEVICWNEDNYDICKHLYMKQAFEHKAYGFVPDYARLDILYNEGGFYLDTDVEIKRNIDNLRYQYAFCGVEKWQLINFGGLSGAVKGNKMIRKFIDARKDIMFIDNKGNQNRHTCGYYDTILAIHEGYKISGRTQTINNMNIYAYDYFHPYDYISGISNETQNTYSVHWFNGGWLDEKMKCANYKSNKEYMNGIVRTLNDSEVPDEYNSRIYKIDRKAK